ncbi:MAG: hypothetical protein WA792_17015 [Pseudolabrys sp.]
MADDNPMISGLRARAGQRRKRGGKRFFFPAVRRGRRKEVSLSAQIPFLVSPMSCARCRDPARVMRAQFLPATATRMQFTALRSSTRKSGYARFDPAHNNRAHDREKMRSDFRARPRANRICAAVTNKKTGPQRGPGSVFAGVGAGNRLPEGNTLSIGDSGRISPVRQLQER